MATYYIMYGEPPRRPRWVYFVLGLATATAVLAVGAAFAVWPLVVEQPPLSAEEPGPAPPTPIATAAEWTSLIAEATSETAYTYYLIDTSESMTGELNNAMQGLTASIAGKSTGSQVGIIAFGDTCEEVLPLLDWERELTEQAVSKIAIRMLGRGTDVSCALKTAQRRLQPLSEQGHETEVVLFSDGSLSSVTNAECDGGQAVRSDYALEGRALTRCVGGTWRHQPMPIIKDFVDAGIKINGIYFQPHRHDWADQVELLTKETGGVFVKVRP